MSKKSLSAEEARQRSKSVKFDQNYVICDIDKSIKNTSALGKQKIGKIYPHASLVNVDFSQISKNLRDRGYKFSKTEQAEDIYIEVSW